MTPSTQTKAVDSSSGSGTSTTGTAAGLGGLSSSAAAPASVSVWPKATSSLADRHTTKTTESSSSSSSVSTSTTMNSTMSSTNTSNAIASTSTLKPHPNHRNHYISSSSSSNSTTNPVSVHPHSSHYNSHSASSHSHAHPASYVYAVELTHYLEHSLVPSVVPMPDEYEAKEQARLYLEKLTVKVSPGSKLLPFGSMANGFALKNSDMDLCCVLAPDAPVRNAAELVESLGTLIQQETDFHVKMLPRARIPIIKLTVPPSPTLPFGMACDIGFENRLALENTRLLLTYAMIDPRLRTIVLFLKVWTKRRKINNPYRGTLSSYGYVLLVIHFLTHVKSPAVLPNLQKLPPPRPIPSEEREFSGHDIFFFDDLEALPRVWQTSNSDTVGELLIDFFRYFSKEFNYSHLVLSIRSDGGFLSKESKGWNGEVDYDPEVIVRDLHKLCIEDPFQLNYNVARTVTKDGLYTIRGEFMRAYRLLAPHRANDRITAVINEVCEEREDALVIHPPVEHRNSARRRSAPSPRIGPTHLGSSTNGMNLFGGMNTAPAVPPIPPMSDFRIWSSSINGGHGVGAHVNGTNGSAVVDESAPASPILGLPPPSHPLSTSGPPDRIGGNGPRRTSGQSTLLPAPPHHGLPAKPITNLSSSSALAGRSSPTLERRVSWDGSGSSSSGTNGAYDLHRFFQNQPGETPASSSGHPSRSAMTAPSSPDLGSSSLYPAGSYSSRKGSRGSLSSHYEYHTSQNVGPRFSNALPRHRHSISPSAAYTLPPSYAAAPPSWGYAGAYPLGANPMPGPIFPEEDREAIALENSITFGNFPSTTSALSTSTPSNYGAYQSTAWGNGYGGYAYPISSSTSSTSGFDSSAAFGISPARSIATCNDEDLDPLSEPRSSAMTSEEDMEDARGRRLNGLPPLLPAEPVDDWDHLHSPNGRPRQRGRSVPHVKLGPDGRESILFGEIQVTLPKPVEDDDTDAELDVGKSALPIESSMKDVSPAPNTPIKPPFSIPSLTTSPPTPMKESMSPPLSSPFSDQTSSIVEAVKNTRSIPTSPELIPMKFATPSTILNSTTSNNKSPISESSVSTTPTPTSPTRLNKSKKSVSNDRGAKPPKGVEENVASALSDLSLKE